MKRAIAMFAVGMSWAGLAVAAPNLMHPLFPVFDATNQPVSVTGGVVDATLTCGTCHDADYIHANNSHIRNGRTANCIQCHVEDGRLATEPSAFDAQGMLRRENIRISTPKNANCAACHGVVHSGSAPLTIPDDFEEPPPRLPDGRTNAMTRNTGTIWSPDRVSEAFLNVQGRQDRTHPWDEHARRGVGCTACHFAPNNPARKDVEQADLDYLVQDPRRISTSEFLRRPDHRLATATCKSCHDPMVIHAFLPYRQRHMDVLDCRACHVPEVMGPAVQAVDATVVTLRGGPLITYRGVIRDQGESLNVAFLQGYKPFLMPHRDGAQIAPHNVVTRWFWSEGAGGREVASRLVTQAWLDGERYRADILSTFDVDHDGRLSDIELRLDTPAKEDRIRASLAALGVSTPVIQAVIEPVPVNHGVLSGERVRRQCGDCHDDHSVLVSDVPLAGFVPGGVRPALTSIEGGLQLQEDARGLALTRNTVGTLHVFGLSRHTWANRMGLLFLGLVVIGVMVHAVLRIRAGRHHSEAKMTRRTYLYTGYERLWHWLMALCIIVLMITGLVIHFGGDDVDSLVGAIRVHNVFAVLMVINAGLSLFYHLASNAFRQFVPPRGNLVVEVKAQARYYLRGIFLGQPHPTPKTEHRKMNALQQITYLALLNILFPLQVITGILIWGVSRWPELATSLGGLSVVAPVHAFGSWLFIAFFVLHLYLVTTGHTVLSNVMAMIEGWEDIPVSEESPSKEEDHV